MTGLPKKLSFLARMPPYVSIAASSSPSPPPFTGGLICSQGSPLVLEPYRFSPDSFGWYGGLEELEDPFVPLEEEYVGSTTVNSQLGVEFPLPSYPSITNPSDAQIIISTRYNNATTAGLKIVLQYFDLADNLWNNQYSSSVTLSSGYTTNFISGIFVGLPNLPSITKLRVVVIVATLDAGDVRINHLTIAYCSIAPALLPPPPSPPLTEPIQPPDVPGTLPPFIEIETPLPPLPPPPPVFLPPLPPGSEILRPNRDILVRLWQPRPAFMQLNDPLNPDNPVDAAVPLYGPATIDTFDEATGNYTGTIRPRLEVGFTNPITEGPWDALQLRFRAARSRPPQPETPAPPLPIPATKEPAVYPCPPPQQLTPRATDFSGIWQVPPLEVELTAPVAFPLPANVCFITAPVNVPPGAPGQIALTPSPIHWDAGYNQIKVRLIAKARSNAPGTTDNSLSGVQANIITFAPTSDEVAIGVPNYQVRWNPFAECNNQLMAYRVSSTEISGAGVLQTNIDIHAEFFFSGQDSDNFAVSVSTDGINYYGAVVFDLAAFQSTVIYYKIALNKGGLPTPVGSTAISAALMITGPYVVTGLNIIQYSQDIPPFFIQVTQTIGSTLQLTSECRVGVSLQGNMDLMESLIQHTDNLTLNWLEYDLIWNGFWSANNIKDLRIRLSSEALLLDDDIPFIDICAMDAIISPWCPGISQPISQPLIKLNQVDVIPMADISVTAWTPIPAWIMLVTDPTLASDNDVIADPRTNNQLLLEMAAPTGLPIVMSGYVREWITVEAIIQARLITWSSVNANLLVSTNFGQEQWTSPLTSDQALYFITWNYDPGLTTDQINRLKVAVIANSLGGNGEIQDPVEVALCALSVRLTFQDVLITPAPSPTPSPPSPPDTIMTVVESTPEIFSCGSLGDCAAPQGKLVAQVMVTNPDATLSTVNFIADGSVNLRISDLAGNSYSSSQPIAGVGSGKNSITFFIYGWIGDQIDSFPVDPEDGGIIVSLIYSAGVHQISVPWYYIGL
jgi:hypothetical protein